MGNTRSGTGNFYYTGRRLPAPRSATDAPNRSVCEPPGKYASTYAIRAIICALKT